MVQCNMDYDRIEFQLEGFSCDIGEDITYDEQIQDNKPFVFENHKIFHSIYITDDFSRMILELKDGVDINKSYEAIVSECEKFCYNIISRTDKAIHQPLFKFLSSTQDFHMRIDETISLREVVCLTKKTKSDSFYKLITENEVLIEKSGYYKAIFNILQAPNIITQFIGLYDILIELISYISSPKKEIKQTYVLNYFKKHKEHGIGIISCERDKKIKEEDAFTKIRNDIAHSRRISPAAYSKIESQINLTTIKKMLVIINDLIIELGDIKENS